MPTVSTCDICGKTKYVIVTIRIRGENKSETASFILCKEHHMIYAEKQNALLSELKLNAIKVKI